MPWSILAIFLANALLDCCNFRS